MKRTYLLIVLSSLFVNLYTQTFSWAKREGLWAYDYGYGVTTDVAGNVYVAGKYELNANFSSTILPCEGNHDIYLAKYLPNGTLDWVTTAGGTLGDYAHSIYTDGVNYIYISGEIEGYGTTISFEGSSVTLTCLGDNDAFLAKYDMSGNLIWARRAGAYQSDKALGITADALGNVYIGGYFNDTAFFGNTTIYGYGDNDIYIAKYDANGNFQWVRKSGGIGRDEAKSIKCDALGNIYITGMFWGNAAFGTQNVSAPNGYYDMFLAKYDPSGNLIWVSTAGGNYDEVGWSMAFDNAGLIYITGEFNASAMFGPYQLITSGNADVFVACYNTSGTCLWAKGTGGPLIDRARGLGCDGTNLYITGQFGMSASFGPYTVTGADSTDIFIAALDNSGNFTWAVSVGGGPDSLETLSYESGNAVCAEPNGNVYATGSLLTSGVFGSTSINTYDRSDVFLTKLISLSVATDEEAPETDVHVYPNPTSGELNIMVTAPNGERNNLKIYDILGQETKNMVLQTGLNRINLDTEKKGIYFIDISSGETKIYRKKIILH